jgi:hypothetical protein
LGEQQGKNLKVSPMVQQVLSKLNVRMTDFMEQINSVINVLFEENVVLRAKLANAQPQSQQQTSEECVKK